MNLAVVELFPCLYVQNKVSQQHICFCLHARVWLLYFIRSWHFETNEIALKLLKISKITFRNTTSSKAIRLRFSMQSQEFR